MKKKQLQIDIADRMTSDLLPPDPEGGHLGNAAAHAQQSAHAKQAAAVHATLLLLKQRGKRGTAVCLGLGGGRRRRRCVRGRLRSAFVYSG